MHKTGEFVDHLQPMDWIASSIFHSSNYPYFADKFSSRDELHTEFLVVWCAARQTWQCLQVSPVDELQGLSARKGTMVMVVDTNLNMLRRCKLVRPRGGTRSLKAQELRF